MEIATLKKNQSFDTDGIKNKALKIHLQEHVKNFSELTNQGIQLI